MQNLLFFKHDDRAGVVWWAASGRSSSKALKSPNVFPAASRGSFSHQYASRPALCDGDDVNPFSPAYTVPVCERLEPGEQVALNQHNFWKADRRTNTSKASVAAKLKNMKLRPTGLVGDLCKDRRRRRLAKTLVGCSKSYPSVGLLFIISQP